MLLVLIKHFSDAVNMTPLEQGFVDLHANETVPNCMGNELLLSNCQTAVTPSRCGDLCARVNCGPAKTPPAVQVPLLTPSARETVPAVIPSAQQRALSLTNTHPQTITLQATHTPQTGPQSLSSNRKAAASSTGIPAKTTDNPDLNLDKLIITLIGVVTMVLVVGGTGVAVCLIACRVKRGHCHHIPKNGPLPIVTGDNMAYVEPKRSMRLYMEKNPAYTDLHPAEPIYENLE